ncbi:hypothetical protein ABPG75_001773 [Micractinium tetrahymenae]
MRAAALLGAGAALAAAAATRRLPRCLSRLGGLRPVCSTNATTDVVDTPPARKIKVALCQLSVGADKQGNLATARSAIDEAASAGADLVVLPEMWNCPYSNDSFPTYAEDVDAGESPSAAMLATAAADNRVVLVRRGGLGGSADNWTSGHPQVQHALGLLQLAWCSLLLGVYCCWLGLCPPEPCLQVGGSIPERAKGGRLYNTCLVHGRDGRLLGRHRKVHLFDIDIPGKITFKESLTLTPGEGLTVVDTEVGRLGIGICYDIRFPEMAMLYAARGVQLIVYPGAFNMTTGPAHWQLLQQARAVDNQLFVATCSPARGEGPGYIAWGHSTAVGPFAEILGSTDEKPGIVYAEMDFAQLAERRANMPLRQQKRADLYALMDLTR